MNEDEALLRKWVATWQRAGVELEQIRRRELENVDTVAAVRQIFGGVDWQSLPPAEPWSGLVEQQAWFSRLRGRRRE